MADLEFTSGALRDLNAHELGMSGFTDIELLSDSGHNYVYRAMTSGKWVLLKTAKEEEGNTTRNRLLLEREYDIMHRIDCLYVVKTWQMADVPTIGRAIVMEYVQGRTLDRFLAEKPSAGERRRVADELMEALIYLHDRRIVHGDLKSSNILITDAGNHVRLIDFGFADTDAYVAKNIGTSASVAEITQPEQDELPVEKDIYGLGKIFDKLSLRGARMVVKRCCTKRSARRYKTVREVRGALRRIDIWWRMLTLVAGVAIMGMLLLTLWPKKEEALMPAEKKTETENTAGTLKEAEYASSAEKEEQALSDQPKKEAAWPGIKRKAETEYRGIYRLYADSLAKMPEKNKFDAIAMMGRYSERMMAERDRQKRECPEFAGELEACYMQAYNRDYPLLGALFEDYPTVKE